MVDSYPKHLCDPTSEAISLLDSFGVSRETYGKLRIYEALLNQWQRKINLVSKASLQDCWMRHFVDSLQLIAIVPNARHWLDIGSGAGFPGMPIAIHLACIPGTMVHLIERDGRKCAFLREVARETRASATIHHGSVEDVIGDLKQIEVVTSRAVTSLPTLLDWAGTILNDRAIGLFLKGQDVDVELTAASRFSNLILEVLPSRIGSAGYIVKTYPSQMSIR